MAPVVRAAVLLAVLCVLSACVPWAEDPSVTPKPVAPELSGVIEVPAALRAFYTQKLTWRECRGNLQCTRLTVPLDYDDPAGRTIDLAVLRVPARDQEGRVGSLVVNPGGPGGSGVDYAAGGSSYWGTALLRSFDIVGFDPRGVGESSPVDCLPDERLDEVVAADPDPDTAAEVRRGNRLIRTLLTGCLRDDKQLTTNVSTADAARDIDILRAALGDDRLAYFGASYGTFLGATYAELFPDRVGRMVLDGAIDPTASTVESSLVQARGFETALRAYVEHCVSEGDCYLGASVDAGVSTIQDFLDALDRAPIEGSGDRRLTEGLAVLGIIAPLYNRDYWPILDAALAAGLRGSGRQLVELADLYTSRGPNGYTDNSIEALYVVNCLDTDDAVPQRRVPEYEQEFVEAAPTFGRMFAAGLSSCRNWPVEGGKGPDRFRAEGSAPIMVVGTTRDPATPLAWAESLVEQLDNAVLVERDGDGHTAYRAGNQCVDDTIEDYLVGGVVPEDTVSC